VVGRTPLFHKPWGLPEFFVILVALVLLDAFTPFVDILPFFQGYFDAARDLVIGLIP